MRFIRAHPNSIISKGSYLENILNSNLGNTKRFYRINELAVMLSVSKSTIWNWVKKGSFPQAFKLAENTTAWRSVDIEKWIENRILM